MPQYVIVAYENAATFPDMSPDEMQRIVQRYYEWTNRLAQAGKLRDGKKLKDGEGRLLKGSGAKMVVTDGPFSEVKEIIGGFWIIEAADYDDAVRTVAGCPHLDFGTLGVRALDETS